MLSTRERHAEWVTAARLWLARSPRLRRVRERHARLFTWVTARFARGGYLGLHLTIGLALSIAALWLFGGVTEDVVHHDPLTLVDLHLATWLRSHATPLGDQIGRTVSYMGSPVAMAIVGLFIALMLVWRHWWIVLSGWIAAFGGGAVLDWALKRVIHRARPVGAEDFLHGVSFSFPSGHAMGALIGYGMLAYLLVAFWPPARRQKWKVSVAALALILLIGASRLYLGVHFLSDIIGGYAAGVVWLATCVTGIEIALRQRGLAPWSGSERRRQGRQAA